MLFTDIESGEFIYRYNIPYACSMIIAQKPYS